jgi:hypothetical protein
MRALAAPFGYAATMSTENKSGIGLGPGGGYSLRSAQALFAAFDSEFEKRRKAHVKSGGQSLP